MECALTAVQKARENRRTDRQTDRETNVAYGQRDKNKTKKKQQQKNNNPKPQAFKQGGTRIPYLIWKKSGVLRSHLFYNLVLGFEPFSASFYFAQELDEQAAKSQFEQGPPPPVALPPPTPAAPPLHLPHRGSPVPLHKMHCLLFLFLPIVQLKSGAFHRSTYGGFDVFVRRLGLIFMPFLCDAGSSNLPPYISPLAYV